MFAYQPGSKERSELEQRIKHYLGTVTEIPLVIGGEEITTGNVSPNQKFLECFHSFISNTLRLKHNWYRLIMVIF